MPDFGDLINRRFEKASFGGYKAADVDSFMTELTTVLSQNGRETAELNRKLEAAAKKLEKYENEEESLKSTLLNAQRLADKIVKEASEKAELTIKESENQAEQTIRNAKIKAENLIGCAQSEIEMRKDEAEHIKREVSNFKINVMHLYKVQLELINEIPCEDPPAMTERSGTDAKSEPKEQDTGKITAGTAEESLETPEEPSDQADRAADEDDVSKEVEEVEEKEDLPEQKARVISQPLLKTVYPENAVQPGKPQLNNQAAVDELPREVLRDESEAAVTTMQTVRLNLRYNEKTGEYEPIDVQPKKDRKSTGFFAKKDKGGDGLKFGADYNIRTDSFNDDSGHRGTRRK
jgi:cell division initiation protein